MELYAYRCENCGKITHPRRLICDGCGGNTFQEEPLTGIVTLLTHTRVHNLPTGINKPFLDFGMVEFENGVRVTGQLELSHEPYIGMKLQASVGVVREIHGEEKHGFIFTE